MPPAPGRFSTRTCWPSFFESPSANKRANMSIVVPAVIGVMIVMALDGKRSWAKPGTPQIMNSSRAEKALRNDRIRLLLYLACQTPSDAVPTPERSNQGDGTHRGSFRAD